MSSETPGPSNPFDPQRSRVPERDPHWALVAFAIGTAVLAAVMLSVVGGRFFS